MGQERRAYPRRPVHWEASVSGDGLSEQRMTIRDFCVGGLFLQYPAGRPVGAIGTSPSQGLEIRFEDPSSGETCRCQGRLVRDTGNGLAVSFDGPQFNAITILSAVAQGQSEPSANGVVEAAGSQLTEELLSLCRNEAIAFAERVIPVFTGNAIDALARAARDAASNPEQGELWESHMVLRQRENEIVSNYVSALAERMAAIAGQSAAATAKATLSEKPSSIADLELVDHDDFEDWLNRSEVVNQAEYLFSGELERLTRRLGYVAGRRLDEQANPLGPSVLTEILTESLPLDRRATLGSQTLYRLFGRHVLEQLGELYEHLNQMLRERGILPELENERPEIRSLGGSQRSQWIRRAQIEDAGTSGGIWRAFHSQQALGDLPEALAQGQVQALSHLADDASKTVTSTSSTQAGGAHPDVPAPSASREATQTPPSRWLGVQRTLREARVAAARRPVTPRAVASSPLAPDEGRPGAAEHDAPADPRTPNSQLKGASSSEPPTLERLLARLDVASLDELSESLRERVEVIADWFEDIAANAVNAELLRSWSRPVAEVALEHRDEFLAERRYPIHDLIDQWDRAAIALEAVPAQHRQGLRRHIDAILERICEPSSEDPGIIADAASQISALVDAPLEARAANLQRLTEKNEGSKRLDLARAQVSHALNERLLGRRIPAPLNEFIANYWHHILVLIWLGNDVDSEHWQRALAVIDRLLRMLGVDDNAGRAVPDHEKVFAFIEKQLHAYDHHSGEAQQLLARMKRHADAVCAGDSPDDDLPFVRVSAFSEELDASDGANPYWLGVVKLLRPGQWVRVIKDGDQAQVLRLQWVNDEQTRFVFADYAGEHALDYGRQGLTNAMAANQVQLTEPLDAPLSERQWHRKLHAAHEAIIELATHDHETGLLNRKALIRELERIEEKRRGSVGDHALVAFRLSTSHSDSYDAQAAPDYGLTAQFARELRDGLGDDDRLARTDTTSFVALLTDHTVARAEIAAEELRRHLAQHLATTNGDAPITVSAGLIGFQFGGLQHSIDLITEAEDVAGEAAASGRAGVVTRRTEHRDMAALRDNMKRVARLDAALEAGALRLRAQRIQPTQRLGRNREPMREILIAVGSGEDGEQLLSPAQFIPAAEQFGRMASVDRWVIRRVLEWCRDNPRQANGVGTFTINLAGSTLGDAGLVDYLSGEFARTGIAPGRICFELSETVAVQNLARVADLVTQIRRMGCHFALDDVGTGYGSNDYLATLPVDFIKVDGSFVRQIVDDETDAAIVSSINELAHHLGKTTIAEYVENEPILERLEAIGIDYVQGYGVGSPESLDDLPLV